VDFARSTAAAGGCVAARCRRRGCSDAGEPAVPGDAVSRDEPALQRLLHHDAAEAQSWRAAALPVSVARSPLCPL